MGTRTLRRVAAAGACAVVLGLAPAGVAMETAEAAGCSVTWGSLPEVDRTFTPNDIEDVRTGRHACFDRLVLDLDRRGVGYDVRYGTVHAPGSGFVVPLRGAADIEVDVAAWGRSFRVGDLADVSGYDTFRQVRFAGTFEGRTTIGLGVRARLPMRVFELDGPGTGSRLVIDVAHRW
ncbi:AMIN-like domain-containing (lipo)protein [Desertihabitans aurantiacus]|uniref:AMIN-like domain-containing (lipo)protein n=1 Tax=Desertihabitans aurantiacus TaxID=2282477 RepID=UPI000DF867F3|nr:hypothetical protein [Desertihabitans aurantiacus]